MRDIKIKKVFNGFRVKIGCQEVVFGSKKKLMNELSRYIDTPEEVEKEYQKKYGKEETERFLHIGNQTYGTVGYIMADFPMEETKGIKVELSNE